MATPTAISFFTGYGGIDLGLRRVVPALRTICYVEREAYAVANLVQKIQALLLDDAPVWSDISTFDYAGWRGMVDVAHGGAPCQPHSHAGIRRGGADERFLFDVWLDGLGLMQPGIIFVENVEGILTSRMPDGTLCLQHILKRLEDIGYCVEDDLGQPTFGIFSAAEVSAPHRRKRVFILAIRRDLADSGDRLLSITRRRAEERDGTGSDGQTVANGENSDGRLQLRAGEQNESPEPGRSGQVVAQSSVGGFRELRESSGSNGQSDGCDEAMANSNRRFEPGRRAGHGETATGRTHDESGRSGDDMGQWLNERGSSGPVDNASSPRRNDAGHRPSFDGEGGQCVSGAGCGELAESHSIGSQVRPSQFGDNQPELPSFERSFLPEFSPGPADRAAWRRILRDHPELAPALKSDVRGVAARPSERVDRLRLLGNGVVPATAAKAFATLFERACRGCLGRS